MTGPELSPGRGGTPRRTVPLERAEALRLLAAAPFGRIVFTADALPAVRPVNHLIGHGGEVIVRTQPFAGLARAALGGPAIVAYHADEIDPVRRTGWSVLVTGPARLVTAAELAAEYARRLGPWGDPHGGVVIGIEPTLVTGTRLIEEVPV
ncbi:pyridoxamine 5'-phosphate oxidase family protein [Nocardia fusca]|uniref:pyridoxamine 5'-phosphate oxidase family protein n=1 Tax=Nocardia fusca TaxID=941183 RepID=UPI0037C95F56